ncbi:MAG: Ig-like domain-containing protein, partial [Pseudomonadota bacterium]
MPPVAQRDVFEIDEGEVLTGNLFADNGQGADFDLDGDPLTITEVNGSADNVGVAFTNAFGATLRVEENGDFTYTPDPTFDIAAGITIGDNFSYRVSDGIASDLGFANVLITGIDPVAPVDGFNLTLPDSLSLGQNGNATLSFDEPVDNADQPLLFAVSAERGLVADPLSGGFSDTAFVLAMPDGDGTVEALNIDVKGTAGPRSSVNAAAQVADSAAVSDIAARVLAFQPDFIEQGVLDRIEANLEMTFGATIGTLTSSLVDHVETFASLGLNASSATGALAFAIEAAGDYGSLAERGQIGSLGQGWAALADLGLEIDGTSVQMTGLADLGALRALSVDASALYAVSNSAGRAVSLSGDVLALAAPPRPQFEQGIDGQFQTVSAFDGTLMATDEGYVIETPDGEELVFDATGTFLAMILPDGLRVEASYDGDGQLQTLSGPNGALLDFTYTPNGLLSRVEDADGDAAAFGYDGNGQLASVTRPEGVSSFAYDGVGDLVQATAPGAITAAFTFDAMGRLDSADYGNGAQTESFAYDDAGGLTITDGAGRSVEINLLPGSVAGRVTDGAGSASELIYDEAGNIAGVRAPDGTETGFAFDDQGRLTQITDANGAVLEFGYGDAGEDPTSFTDAGGNTRSFDYDSGGRITEATWPDGTSLQFVYDAEGNLTGYENRRGDEVTYTYDERGRVTSESDGSAGATSYTYDDRGRLTSATNDQGTTSLVYDTADRVVQIDYPTGKSLFYTYNGAGLRASISDGGDYDVFYSYDALGRLTGLSDEDGTLVAYQYDAAGNLTREENGNGTTTLYTYDDAGRLTGIENLAPDASINSFNTYTYDAAGQRIENATQDGVWTYGYDATGQLVSANFASTNAAIADKSIAYDYDA